MTTAGRLCILLACAAAVPVEGRAAECRPDSALVVSARSLGAGEVRDITVTLTVNLPETARRSIRSTDTGTVSLVALLDSSNALTEPITLDNGTQTVRFPSINANAGYRIDVNSLPVYRLFGTVPSVPMADPRSPAAPETRCYDYRVRNMQVVADSDGEFRLFSSLSQEELEDPAALSKCIACNRGSSSLKAMRLQIPAWPGWKEYIRLQRTANGDLTRKVWKVNLLGFTLRDSTGEETWPFRSIVVTQVR